jgi:phosphatidylserine/phosphatidylglycerophosphate/cardiolipin synthase-like enzyme
MHARAAIADGCTVFLGSISLSPNSTRANREVGFISRSAALSRSLADQFNEDY